MVVPPTLPQCLGWTHIIAYILCKWNCYTVKWYTNVSATQSPVNGVNKPIIFNVTASDSSLGNTGLTDVSPWRGLQKNLNEEHSDRPPLIDFWNNSFFSQFYLAEQDSQIAVLNFLMAQNSCQWKPKWHGWWIGVIQWPHRDMFLTDILFEKLQPLNWEAVGKGGEEMGRSLRTGYRNSVC